MSRFVVALFLVGFVGQIARAEENVEANSGRAAIRRLFVYGPWNRPILFDAGRLSASSDHWI